MKSRLLLLCLSIGLSACSLIPPIGRVSDATGPGATSDGQAVASIDRVRSRRVVRDFVEAMVQLPELSPATTTLYTALPESHFGALLVAAMQDVGYDLRIGDQRDQGTLQYTIVPEQVDGALSHAEYTFLISAATVKLKRRYRVDAHGVYPATSMFLHGSDAGLLALNPEIFQGQRPTAPSNAAQGLTASIDPSNRRAAELGSPRASVSTPDTVVRVHAVPTAPAAVRVSSSSEPGSAKTGSRLRKARETRPSAPLLKRNLFETRQSNYQAVLQQFNVLQKEVMIFPNDSLVMGRLNKRLARAMAENFDPERDVLSVIGCSHGKSALANGNERLANGRANRVKEEFVLAGIDPELVLEEGCWASTHFDAMPARGVLVTHKRRGPSDPEA